MAALIVYVGLAYLGMGLVFAVAFVVCGVSRVDPGAGGAHWGFRVLIIPGTAALWPVMLRKWVRARKQPVAREQA